MEKLNNNSGKKYPLLKNIFNKDFIVSAIIPIILFYIFDSKGMTLNGVIISGAWCVGVVIVNYIIERKLNALAILSGAFSVIGLVGTIISKNPTIYLVSPIVQDILVAIIFFGSFFIGRPLVQIIVEQSFLKNASEELKKHPKYKSAWNILTIVWGFVSVSYAVIRIILLYSVSASAYYAISTAYSSISTPLIIAFCIMFPKWYWRRYK